MAIKKKTAKKQVTAQKPTKPDDMESTKDVQTTKSVRQIVGGTHALIKVSIFTPGYSPLGVEITIPDIVHTQTLNVRTPQSIVPEILKGLRAKYGQKVKVK